MTKVGWESKHSTGSAFPTPVRAGSPTHGLPSRSHWPFAGCRSLFPTTASVGVIIERDRYATTGVEAQPSVPDVSMWYQPSCLNTLGGSREKSGSTRFEK